MPASVSKANRLGRPLAAACSPSPTIRPIAQLETCRFPEKNSPGIYTASVLFLLLQILDVATTTWNRIHLFSVIEELFRILRYVIQNSMTVYESTKYPIILAQ